MPDLAKFEIELAPNGRGKIILNGEDISSRVHGLRVDAEANSVPIVSLEIHAGTIIEGEGIVRIRYEHQPFDAVAIEAEALSRMSWNKDLLMVQAVLDIVDEQL